MNPGWWSGGLALGPVRGPLQADLLVVGLGGAGLGAVHRGLDLGLTVIGVDAGAVAGGAAGRNGGFLLAGLAKFHHQVVEQLGNDDACRWFRRTSSARNQMMAETPACVRRAGSLRRCTSPEEEDDARTQLDRLRQDGFSAQWIDEPEGRGVLVPEDAVFEPHRRARILARRALRRGARLFEGSPVAELGDGWVRTEGGERLTARHIVVATDGGLGRWVEGLTTVRLQMAATVPASDVRLRRAVYSRYGLDYWQQRGDGSVFVGGGRDVDPDAEGGAQQVTAAVQRHLDQLLGDVVGTRAPVEHRWAGLVSYTADGIPVLQRRGSSVALCGGYNGTGNVVGWMLARTAVDVLAGRTVPEPARLTGLGDGR